MVIEICALKQTVYVDGHVMHFSKKEYALLALLVENKHKILHNDEIYRLLWDKTVVQTNTVGVHICKLRRRLGRDTILTKNSTGYIINCECSVRNAHTESDILTNIIIKYHLQVKHDIFPFFDKEEQKIIDELPIGPLGQYRPIEHIA